MMPRWRRRLIGVKPEAALAALATCEEEGQSRVASLEEEFREAQERLAALKEEWSQLEAQEAKLDALAHELATAMAELDGKPLDALARAISGQREQREQLQQLRRQVEERHERHRALRERLAAQLRDLVREYRKHLSEDSADAASPGDAIRPAGGLA